MSIICTPEFARFEDHVYVLSVGGAMVTSVAVGTLLATWRKSPDRVIASIYLAACFVGAAVFWANLLLPRTCGVTP